METKQKILVIPRHYLEEFLATPANTLGMGGIISPETDANGSGDIVVPICINGYLFLFLLL